MAGLNVAPRRARVAPAAAATAALFAAGFAGGLQLVPTGHSTPAAAPAVPAAAAPAAVAQPISQPVAAVTAADASRYFPLYHQAARRFGVNWLLIASIHSQETAFSTAPGTYQGLNFARCCAGPMQFNVKNGKPSTWQRFRDAYTRGPRPASYPHATASHPSVYDDYDAIMAAGSLLRANGAGQALDGSAWSAAYQYYGPGDPAAVDYANQVLARATTWQRSGFDPKTVPDASLVASFEAAYGGALRAQLTPAQPAAHDKRHAKHHARHAPPARSHHRHPAPAPHRASKHAPPRRPAHHTAPPRHTPEPAADPAPAADAAAGRTVPGAVCKDAASEPGAPCQKP